VLPVAAGLGAVLLLSLLGIAAPWDSDPTPARGSGDLDKDGSVLVSPSASPAGPPGLSNRSEAGQNSPTPPPTACQPALSVAVSPDLAPLVAELAGPLATAAPCPQVTVEAHGPSATAGTLAADGGAPAADVWIPPSTLSLRRAGSAGGHDFPDTGTPLARTPVVIAMPQQVADSLTGFPVWVLIYNGLDSGDIPRMSMPDYRTTIGALAQVTLQEALRKMVEGNQDRQFLALINYRNKLATTTADVEALLDRMAGSTPSAAGAEVGGFPVTEQRLIAYHRAGPAVPVAPIGTYDANIEADYPMVVSRSLDDRLAGIAGALRARLGSAEAVQRFVTAGFRPPDDPGQLSAGSLPTGYRNPFPTDVDYPAPVDYPDQAKWQSLVDGWTWTG
ncbi:MAG: substrate-binding domain-containing protein, partial [Natronosporangium sp.]